MEPSASRLEHDAAGRTHQHARNRTAPVAMLAEDVADARSVTRADRREVDFLACMVDDERRVVLDPRSRVERADQVVDLLPGRHRQPQPLVERAYALDDAPAQEDRERDRAVPEVVARQGSRICRPPGLASGDAVEIGEPRRDALEQVGRIRAVVVRKRDDVGLDARQDGIARAGEPAGCANSLDAKRRMGGGDPFRPVVVVLIGEQDAEALMRLPLERAKERVELVDAIDGRDDKVESHGRTLTPVPLVSVLLAVHDDSRFLRDAIQSILGQTLDDLELLVVDDASTDSTPTVLAHVDDPRLTVLRNDRRLGLAASLNRGLDHAGGRYVARLDADDVAVPDRLERQVERMRSAPGVAIVGSAVVDLDEDGRRGETHVMPSGARTLRWHALFSSPFFHPSVLFDRAALERRELRYDPEFLESEDYDLWARLFAFDDGDNLREPLVLKRVHAGQASQRRGDVQKSFQRRVALREIGRVAPHVDAERAWRAGARKEGGSRRELLRLLRAFERRHGGDWSVRGAALRSVLS